MGLSRESSFFWTYSKGKLGKQCGGKLLWRLYYKTVFLKVKGATPETHNEQEGSLRRNAGVRQ